MSRIIRSLESRERPYIHCRINPNDKRKIDVCLTPAGEKALLDYQTTCIRGIADILGNLNEEEQDDLARLVERAQQALERTSGSYCSVRS
jgi:DNA-binding MarR family transcriptional regulator